MLCAASIVVDLAKVIDAYPALDHLAMIEQVTTSTGGPGLNMAVDLRLLGATFPIGILGAVGDDEHGAFVAAECARLGIDTTGLRRVPDVATAFTDAMVERDGGRRTFFHHSGANARFDAWAPSLEASSAGSCTPAHPACTGTWTPRGPAAATAGRRSCAPATPPACTRTSSWSASARERMAEVARPCLPYVDSLVINELEAGALTGIERAGARADGPVDWAALEAMARGLIESASSKLAVVHFPAGAVAAAPGGRTWRQGSVRLAREEVRSTIGAGDAFAAGVILGLHEGWPVERCLRLGAASAAACVRGPRTSDGIRPAADSLADGRPGRLPGRRLGDGEVTKTSNHAGVCACTRIMKMMASKDRCTVTT